MECSIIITDVEIL